MMTRRLLLLTTAVLLLAAAFAGAQTPAPSIEYYETDALGNIRVVTNHVGSELRRHEILPFGEEWTEDASVTPDVRLFTGKERDYETGLDYFGARYYRAEIGRFTSVDPVMTVQQNLVDPQRWNRYAYVRNNPLRFTDPDGRDWWDIVNGALNAFASNAGFAPRSSGNSDYRKGQLIGDVGSLVASGAEFVGGGTVSSSGVVACGTGVGCLVGAPAVAEGGAVMTHAVVFGTNAGVNLMKSFSDDATGGSAGNFKKATGRQLEGVDEHLLKKEWVGRENISKFNISIDSTGQVVLTPVKKGASEVVSTGHTLDELRQMFPKQ